MRMLHLAACVRLNDVYFISQRIALVVELRSEVVQFPGKDPCTRIEGVLTLQHKQT